MINDYKHRIADVLLQRKLRGMGADLIEGSKWCGKTTTAEHQAASVVYMDDIKDGSNWQQMASINPQAILVV